LARIPAHDHNLESPVFVDQIPGIPFLGEKSVRSDLLGRHDQSVKKILHFCRIDDRAVALQKSYKLGQGKVASHLPTFSLWIV
jgi:hypothetical protein